MQQEYGEISSCCSNRDGTVRDHLPLNLARPSTLLLLYFLSSSFIYSVSFQGFSLSNAADDCPSLDS